MNAEGAAAQAFELEWNAPAQCPTLDFVQSEVIRVVGRPWHELGAQWRQARASVSAEAGGFRLHLSVVTQGGAASERNVLAGSCTEATEAAVAILTAGIAPDRASSEAERSLPSVGAPSTVAAGPADRQESGDTSSRFGDDATRGIRARPVVSANLGLDLGTLAEVAPFAQITAGVELHRFAASGFVGATGRVLGELDGTAAGAQMFMLMAGLSGCYRITQQNPAILGCGGVEIGSLEASGFGAIEGQDGRAFWSASLAQGVLDWHITEGSVASIGVTAVFPFRQLQVVLSPEEVHRTPPVSARPWLGIGLRF